MHSLQWEPEKIQCHGECVVPSNFLLALARVYQIFVSFSLLPYCKFNLYYFQLILSSESRSQEATRIENLISPV